MAVGAAGAKNAALFAARILALKHEEIRRAVEQHRQKLAGA
jgi:phosphoribosylcarboxyaminoimidazole (NCAIR) mutase